VTNRSNLRVSALAATAAIVLAGGAQATNVLFTITETGETITFTLPESPTEIYDSMPNDYFALKHEVRVDFNGATGRDILYFYNLSQGGGLENAEDVFQITGDQFYTGDESAPTFTLGTYTGQYDVISQQPATVAITAVPEPAAWTLMLVGFGGLGGALRARRRPARSSGSALKSRA
jgi:hypothetical protein